MGAGAGESRGCQTGGLLAAVPPFPRGCHPARPRAGGSAEADTNPPAGLSPQEMVLLEIDVMNQLNHRNLIQLYDAIETPREIILFMEFIEGGELFERIVDDDYHLTEVDCMVFVRQICEGIRFMHHMRVLHLDLKLGSDWGSLSPQPENILCVAATGHMVKIIDFGLARRCRAPPLPVSSSSCCSPPTFTSAYNPQEKLKVNFGTPEFLSPEVVNYEQVSYSTDMWSMGVITYMLYVRVPSGGCGRAPAAPPSTGRSPSRVSPVYGEFGVPRAPPAHPSPSAPPASAASPPSWATTTPRR
ncbi:Myosin light chain kinase 2, skeletal/cardiac muscle [Aix galericulata]|nr:Myosin light chain kinase 2, skeletal/cardiac muscle [Aix galericulata]